MRLCFESEISIEYILSTFMHVHPKLAAIFDMKTFVLFGFKLVETSFSHVFLGLAVQSVHVYDYNVHWKHRRSRHSS
jgi:hypothetical protein